MGRSEEFMFIKEYIDDVTLKHNATAVKHMQALWTAFVLHAGIFDDEKKCSEYLANLLEFIGQDIPDDYFRDFDDFYTFMMENFG